MEHHSDGGLVEAEDNEGVHCSADAPCNVRGGIVNGMVVVIVTVAVGIFKQ